MIEVGIVGFGNVGRGVFKAVEKNSDMEVGAIFTRRPDVVRKELKGVFVFDTEQAFYTPGARIDVMILCGGSKEDLPVQGPKFAQKFNTVDSFDTHDDIPDYFEAMKLCSEEGNNVSVISAGWDPGIFSLERVFGDAFLPLDNKTYTFWGKGVSQGHSDAARKVNGVADARQYTIPLENSLEKVRKGESPTFTKRQMHKRLVYVVPEEDADLESIEKSIVLMPNYFNEYDTEVVFISKEEMKKSHSDYTHGGFVLTSGETGEGNNQILEYKCHLENNPEFTGSVLAACARAASKLNRVGRRGAFTMLDIPPCYLSPHSSSFLRKKFM